SFFLDFFFFLPYQFIFLIHKIANLKSICS
ncbi:hypothetical protein, partial [Plasmodium yoelii yoelii]